MNIEQSLHNLLKSNGYAFLGNVDYYIKFYINNNQEKNETKIIGVINEKYKRWLNNEKLDDITFQIERKLLLSGTVNIDVLYLIMSYDFQQDKRFAESDEKFWILDLSRNSIIIFENQPDDFGNLRAKIEKNIDMNIPEKQRGPKTLLDIKAKDIPWVTCSLIIINCLIYLILEIKGDTKNAFFMIEHGAMYKVFENHEYYRLFTSMFLHFGITHLMGNMVSLLVVGNSVEKFYGKIKFLIIYLSSGLFGSFMSGIINERINPFYVSAGASGAICGIIGAMVYIFLKTFEGGKYIRFAFIAIMLIMITNTSGNVDNLAHVAGFIAGMLAGFLVGNNKEKRKTSEI